MPKVVEVPGLGNVEFPDSMRDDQITNAIRRELAKRTMANLPSADTPKDLNLAEEAVGFLKGAVVNTMTGLYDAAKRVASGPQNDRDWKAFAVMGPLGPLVSDIAQSHVDTGRKAVEHAQRGELAQAGSYALATALPMIGPAAAASAEKIGEGKIGEGLGEVAAGMIGPKGASNVKQVKVKPFGRRLSDVDQAAVNFADRADVQIPLDAATRGGSKLLRNTQALIQNQPLGANYAQGARQAQDAALTRVGRDLARRIDESHSTPEIAAGRVREQVESNISQFHREAGENYDLIRELEKDPANVHTLQVGVDKEGKPVYEQVPMPVDMRPVKRALRPIHAQLTRQMPIAQQRASAGLRAIENILDEADYKPASLADADLSAIKAAARGADLPELRSVAQGFAAKAVESFDAAVQDAIGKARRSSSRRIDEPAAVTPIRQAAADVSTDGSATTPNRNLAGVVGTGETRVRVPGDERSYAARYEVRELGGLDASHDGMTFQPNRNYRLRNDRDYTRTDNQGKVVSAAGDQFDPAYLVSDNPDAVNGPLVIDSAGQVLGGNGRKMVLDRVYRSNERGTAAYRSALEQRAALYGLDPAQISGMKQPVLVRVISDTDLPDAATRQRAITDFNRKGTAELTPAERMVVDSRRVSQGTLDDLAGRLEKIGDDATLADALDGPSGAEVLQKLIDDGVISPQERAALAEGDILTAAGRQRVSGLLVGRFFRDSAQLSATPRSLRAKLERMAAPLARADGEWDLTPRIQSSLELIEAARVHGTPNLDDFIRQGGLFADQQYPPDVVQLAKQLQATAPRKLEAAARQYAEDASFARGGGSLFGDTPTPDASFASAFGGAVDNATASLIEAPPVPTQAPPKSVAPLLDQNKIRIISTDAGAESLAAMQRGREATRNKYEAAAVLDELRKEPVQLFRQLTYSQDAGVDFLRRARTQAPEAMKGIGRSLIEGLLDEATAEGGFDKARTLQERWKKIGPETKKILFHNPALIKDIDNFFRIAERIATNPNPSGSAYVASLIPMVGLVWTNPATGAAVMLGNAALSRLLFSPRGSRAITRGMTVPVGNRAAAAIAAGQLLKVAGSEAKPLPKAAQGSPHNEQTSKADSRSVQSGMGLGYTRRTPE